MDHTNNKEATSPKDANHATEKPENPFVVLVNKKIKKVSKKMQRITALEAQLASSKEKVQINEDQKKLLESKEATQHMLKEFEELRTQMLKLLGEQGKETSASKGEKKDSKKKDKAKKDKKKEVKESAPAPAKTSTTPATTAPQQAPAAVEPPKPAETQPAQETKAEEKKEETPAPVQPTAEKTEEQAEGEEGEDEEEEGEGEFADKEALRKEWAAQKEVYVQKYKNTLKAEDENKYIAVHKGVLYGPCDTLQQLKEAQGGQKLEGAFLARVGHEDEPPVRRTRGFRGRGRGFRGRGRGGRGRGAPRGQSQQRS